MAEKKKLPNKTHINLAQRERNNGLLLTAAVGVPLVLLLTFATAKFGVLVPFERLNQAQSAYERTHATKESVLESLAGYDELEREYRTYTHSWRNDKHGNLVDCQQVLDLVETELFARGTVSALLIQNDTLTVSMSGMNLQQISDMLLSLNQQPIVQSASLSLAATGELDKKQEPSSAKATESLNFSLLIALQPAKEAEK